MGFRFCGSMCHDYWVQGYVVFRRILPASLLNDLKPEVEKARALAHELHGPQAQRLQQVEKYEQINFKPFQAYRDLSELRDAVQRLLGPAAEAYPERSGGHFQHWAPGRMSLLVEPSARPRHHGWHRDWNAMYPRAEQKSQLPKALANWHNPIKGNQINCAIYPDASLWYVPGSHLRTYDLPGEAQEFDYHTEAAMDENPIDQMQGTHAQIERAALDKCYSFPRAICLRLDPGDFAIYRSEAWHTGVYSPSQPRATIHDGPHYIWPSEKE